MADIWSEPLCVAHFFSNPWMTVDPAVVSVGVGFSSSSCLGVEVTFGRAGLKSLILWQSCCLSQRGYTENKHGNNTQVIFVFQAIANTSMLIYILFTVELFCTTLFSEWTRSHIKNTVQISSLGLKQIHLMPLGHWHRLPQPPWPLILRVQDVWNMLKPTLF